MKKLLTQYDSVKTQLIIPKNGKKVWCLLKNLKSVSKYTKSGEIQRNRDSYTSSVNRTGNSENRSRRGTQSLITSTNSSWFDNSNEPVALEIRCEMY